MDTLTLLLRARGAGLIVTAEGDTLTVRGPRRLESLAMEVLAHKPVLLAALKRQAVPPAPIPEVAWRYERLRAAIPPRGPIILPTLREHAGLPGTCSLCGDVLVDDVKARGWLRCGPCSEAARLAVYHVREGVR